MTASKMVASDPSHFTDFEQVKIFNGHFANFEQELQVYEFFWLLPHTYFFILYKEKK